MKFELEVDIDTLNKETSRCIGVVFKEDFIREFLSKEDTALLGYLAGEAHGFFDTYEREWLMDALTTKLIGVPVPCNGDDDATKAEFKEKWIEFMTTSDLVDREKSKDLSEDWGDF